MMEKQGAMVDDRVEVLDLGVVDRQQIGASFTRQRSTARRARDVAAGVLHLSPHEAWRSEDLTDWSADPYGDRNWRFQRNTLRWLVPLSFVAEEGDEDAGAEWLRIVRSWTVTHSADLGTDREVWGDMATGLRAIVLSLGAHLVPSDEQAWFRELLELHRAWLADPANLGRGNHALHQHQGLLVVSSLLRNADGQRTAIERMERQFETAFDDEGANDEGSAAYHQLNMIWWAEAWDRVRAEGFATPAVVARRFDAADEVLAHLTLPSGDLVQIGDGPVTRTREGLGPHSAWAASGGTAGLAPPTTTKVLSRGYVLSRSDWTDSATHLALRHGQRPGSGHPHEDRASLLVHSGGVHWLVDSGFSSYQTNDPVVTYLRSQTAHNVPLLEGVPVDPDGEVVLAAANVEDDFREFVIRDERYEHHTLTRRVIHLLGPDCLLVLDSAAAVDGAAVTLTQRWHVNPEVRTRRTDRGFALVAGDTRAVMHWIGRHVRATRHEAQDGSPEGWVYPRWKTPVRSTVIRASARGPKPLAALLFARSAPRELGLVEAHAAASGVISATLTRGPRVWHVVVDDAVTVTAVEREWD